MDIFFSFPFGGSRFSCSNQLVAISECGQIPLLPVTIMAYSQTGHSVSSLFGSCFWSLLFRVESLYLARAFLTLDPRLSVLYGEKASRRLAKSEAPSRGPRAPTRPLSGNSKSGALRTQLHLTSQLLLLLLGNSISARALGPQHPGDVTQCVRAAGS